MHFHNTWSLTKIPCLSFHSIVLYQTPNITSAIPTFSHNNLTQLTFPERQARCKGVDPKSSGFCKSTPEYVNNRIKSAWPETKWSLYSVFPFSSPPSDSFYKRESGSMLSQYSLLSYVHINICTHGQLAVIEREGKRVNKKTHTHTLWSLFILQMDSTQ